MMQASCTDATDVHAGAFSNRFKTLENC